MQIRASGAPVGVVVHGRPILSIDASLASLADGAVRHWTIGHSKSLTGWGLGQENHCTAVTTANIGVHRPMAIDIKLMPAPIRAVERTVTRSIVSAAWGARRTILFTDGAAASGWFDMARSKYDRARRIDDHPIAEPKVELPVFRGSAVGHLRRGRGLSACRFCGEEGSRGKQHGSNELHGRSFKGGSASRIRRLGSICVPIRVFNSRCPTALSQEPILPKLIGQSRDICMLTRRRPVVGEPVFNVGLD